MALLTPQAQRRELSVTDPLGSEEQPWRPDLYVPTLFLAAAAFGLGTIDPLHWDFQPRLIETLAVALLGTGIAGWGAVRRRLPLVMAGSGLLLGLIALCLATQLSQLGTPLASIWPLRAAPFLVVAFGWALLLGLPLWMRRALAWTGGVLAFMLLCAGAPTAGSQLFGWRIQPPANLAPYWLAVDSRGTLYASNFRGNYVWVFDPSGAPRGTLWPGSSPTPGTGEPGILPAGFNTPVPLLPSPAARSTPPLPAAQPQTTFTFCGLAVDKHDNLYVLDLLSRRLLKFRPAGALSATYPIPSNYVEAAGCLAADDDHIYLSSGLGTIYVLDYDARPLREVKVQYQPLGITADGKGGLLVLGSFVASMVNVETGVVSPVTLPSPEGQGQLFYQIVAFARNGELLAADQVSRKITRIDLAAGRVVGTIGADGRMPGQFQGIGGIAVDRAGDVFVADFQLDVIERFSAESKLKGTWWAPGEILPTPVPSDEEEEGG